MGISMKYGVAAFTLAISLIGIDARADDRVSMPLFSPQELTVIDADRVDAARAEAVRLYDWAQYETSCNCRPGALEMKRITSTPRYRAWAKAVQVPESFIQHYVWEHPSPDTADVTRQALLRCNADWFGQMAMGRNCPAWLREAGIVGDVESPPVAPAPAPPFVPFPSDL
jgi:hypothetical protein